MAKERIQPATAPSPPRRVPPPGVLGKSFEVAALLSGSLVLGVLCFGAYRRGVGR
jgi:hypothetical protein